MISSHLVGQLPTRAGARPVRLDVLDGGHLMYFRFDQRVALKEASAALYKAGR